VSVPEEVVVKRGGSGLKTVVGLLAAVIALAAAATEQAAWARATLPPQEQVYAIRAPLLYRHNVGLLDLAITNIGIIGNPFVDDVSAGWQGGDYLYAASLWIGAVASDNLPYVSTGAYETELRPSLDQIDTIYPAYEGVLHGNRPGFSDNADDDEDGLVDEDFPNGRDDDGDGDIDEDFAAISQQMFACEYWDYTDEAQAVFPEHRPLNLKIRQASYSWSTAGANEFVGFDFRIRNEGFELLRDLYLGFFVDSDAGPKNAEGYYEDDRGAYFTTDTTFVDNTINFACDSRDGTPKDCALQTLHLDICYMYDVPDDGENAKGGDVDGYFGGMFLGHTTDPSETRAPESVKIHTARFFSGSNAYPAGDPANDTERYDLLQSGQKQQRPTGPPSDYRYCFSAGPFREFPPNTELELQVAFVIGQFQDGMINNAIQAQKIYNGSWENVDGDVLGRTPPEIGKELCLRAVEEGEATIWRDPCDSLNPTQRTVKDVVCLPENYVDNDCDCCTPLYRDQNQAVSGAGRETLVHWVGPVAPPPPRTNIDETDDPSLFVEAPAGDRRVTIQWDNTAELTADPTQKRILFTGYRIYRVEGWNRPVGSAGPAPTDWSQIADISLDPPDGLGPASPWYLTRFRRDIDSTHIVITGSRLEHEKEKWYYPVGRYSYTDTLGLKNGMLYFYDVTAYSSWQDTTWAIVNGDSVASFIRRELNSQPSASERDAVIPVWPAEQAGKIEGIRVVPNPYVRGRNPFGWDLTPSNADPTGTRIAFVGLPAQDCQVKIYTLSGDLVQTLEHPASLGDGAVFWNLISRNGQDIVSGIYIYSAECGGKNKIGRFVVVR